MIHLVRIAQFQVVKVHSVWPRGGIPQRPGVPRPGVHLDEDPWRDFENFNAFPNRVLRDVVRGLRNRHVPGLASQRAQTLRALFMIRDCVEFHVFIP